MIYIAANPVDSNFHRAVIPFINFELQVGSDMICFCLSRACNTKI